MSQIMDTQCALHALTSVRGWLILVRMTKRWTASVMGGLWGLIGCNPSTCLDYACFPQAQLHGSVVIPSSVTMIQAEYCAADDCRQETFEATPTEACPVGETGICLNGDGETRSLTVTWTGSNMPRPQDTPYSIKLIDHNTGQVLLDETRRLTGHVGSQLDECHDYCWRAEAEL
jgi:hypothetical protein